MEKEITELMNLFEGSDLAIGKTIIEKNGDSRKKKDTRCWTEKRPVTKLDWEKHINGTIRLGIPPINSSSQAKWGAIDVDNYEIDPAEIAKIAGKTGYPLVVTRSKSGGSHIFLFLTEYCDAGDLIKALDHIASELGLGTCEIFPKQASIGHHDEQPDFGNWINMPFFRGDDTEQYSYTPSGTPIRRVCDFIAYVYSRHSSLLDVLARINPDESIFPDGPPCLNILFGRDKKGSTGTIVGNRNVLLSNACVYAKRALQSRWEDRIRELNRNFSEPLGDREVDAIIKSYGSKDYKYQCSKEPLCSHCNSTRCKTKKYGIGSDGILSNNRSLTKVATIPPIWYLDIQTAKGPDRRISLSTEELQSPRLFQLRCIEVLNHMYSTPKPEEWREIVNTLLNHVNIIDVPPEDTPIGQLYEHIEDWIANNSSDDSADVMSRGLVYTTINDNIFRIKELYHYLDTRGFKLLKQHEIIAALKEANGKTIMKKINGKTSRCWTLPR